MEQSPINIVDSGARLSATHMVKLWFNKKNVMTKVVDNGHTVMVTAPISRLVGTDEERRTHMYEAL